MRITFVYLLAFFVIMSNLAVGQQQLSDTSAAFSAKDMAINSYTTAMGDHSEILSGTAYQKMPAGSRGSAYYPDYSYLAPSTIHYNGTWYKQIPLLFDATAGVMVSSRADSLFILRSDKLSDVLLLGHHFIYIATVNNFGLEDGYYDQLYAGNSAVLVKRTNTMQNQVSQRGEDIFYEHKDQVYLKKGRTYIAVNGKGAVLDIFKDKTKQLKQFLKDNKIRYQDNKENWIVRLASYYDQINKSDE